MQQCGGGDGRRGGGGLEQLAHERGCTLAKALVPYAVGRVAVAHRLLLRRQLVNPAAELGERRADRLNKWALVHFAAQLTAGDCLAQLCDKLGDVLVRC